MDLSAMVGDMRKDLTEIRNVLQGMKQAHVSKKILNKIMKTEFHLLEWYRIAGQISES